MLFICISVTTSLFLKTKDTNRYMYFACIDRKEKHVNCQSKINKFKK